MADATEQSLWHRMKYTPVGDALRWRISGRLDVEAQYRIATLPMPVEQLIRRVVKRTRLWRTEKVHVASELISHFADGLASGESADSLVESFGNEQTAAKLIRRAMKRKRSMLWHGMVLLRRLLLVLIALYVLLGIYFHAGSPSPTVDYIAQLNDQIDAIPANDRAWPLYARAIELMGIAPYVTPNSLAEEVRIARPGSAEWPPMREWLLENTDGLDLVRKASAMPALGIRIGAGGSGDDPALYPPGETYASYKRIRTTPLLEAPQTDLVALWKIVDVLAADAYFAIEQDDIPRFLDDIAAIHGVAEHLRDHRGLPSIDWIATGTFREKALQSAIEAFADAPQRFTGADLQRLAHLFAEPNLAGEMISVESERNLARDFIQRVYSDDGGGNGRLTEEGIAFIASLRPESLTPEFVDESALLINESERVLDAFRSIASPVLPLLVASRSEVRAESNALFDLAESNLGKPFYQADWEAWREMIERWRATPASRVKYAVALMNIPALSSFHASAERQLGRRDGLLLAIALELYHREHGSYPDQLDALAPRFIPTLPVDRLTGQPLHYRMIDSAPVIYALGLDGDDDGGRPPLNERGQPAPWLAAAWATKHRGVADGDWVLFPPVQSN